MSSFGEEEGGLLHGGTFDLLGRVLCGDSWRDMVEFKISLLKEERGGGAGDDDEEGK